LALTSPCGYSDQAPTPTEAGRSPDAGLGASYREHLHWGGGVGRGPGELRLAR
jgi:hypothetical protein